MYERILVPLDGSALSEEIIPSVADLAVCAGSEVTLLRVSMSVQPASGDSLNPVDPEEHEREVNRVAVEYMHYLNDTAKRLRALDPMENYDPSISCMPPGGRFMGYPDL